jgi:hypothetical protein
MIMNADILLVDEPKNIQQLPVNHANEAAPKAPAPVRVISDERFGHQLSRFRASYSKNTSTSPRQIYRSLTSAGLTISRFVRADRRPPCKISWTLTQGTLGACAYLATRVAVRTNNPPPPQNGAANLLGDAFDVTDRNVSAARIGLGPLFAFLIAIPFSAQALGSIISGTYDSQNLEIADFAKVILPFLLGFSTNLVLANEASARRLAERNPSLRLHGDRE